MKKKILAVLLVGALACSVMLSGCGNKGIDAGKTAVTFADKELSLGYLNFFIKYNQTQADAIYTQFYAGNYWADEEFGTDEYPTLGDMLKETAVDTIERSLVLESKMADYGIEITDDDMAAIDTAAADFLSANSEDALKAMGATEDYVKQMLYYALVDNRVSQAIGAEDDTVITAEEANQRAISYIRISKSLYIDDNGEQQKVEDDETVDKIRDQYTKVAEEAAADWDTVFGSFEDVSTVSALDLTYGEDAKEIYSSSDFYDVVLAAADKLKEGEVTGLLEAEGAFYIVKLNSESDAEATASKMQEMQNNAATEHVNAVVEELKEATDFALADGILDQVVFDTIFQ